MNTNTQSKLLRKILSTFKLKGEVYLGQVEYIVHPINNSAVYLNSQDSIVDSIKMMLFVKNLRIFFLGCVGFFYCPCTYKIYNVHHKAFLDPENIQHKDIIHTNFRYYRDLIPKPNSEDYEAIRKIAHVYKINIS